MKRSLTFTTTCLLLVLVACAGCSSKLDEGGVNRVLARFSGSSVIERYTSGTGTLGDVGPIMVKENEAKVDFVIQYKTERGTPATENAHATFARSQDGKWLLTDVNSDNVGAWGLGWHARALNWEVK